MILLEYIDSEKYGKIAHFINKDNIEIYARVIEEDGTIIYEELDEKAQSELRIKTNVD